MDATIRYERNFFDDRLSTNLMVGASQEQYKRQYFSATRKDLIDPSLGVIDGAIGESSSTGNITEWAMRSYFGRLNLGWDDKYLFEANLRADGSSRFLADNRWGYFPSFSAAWRISEEEFMKNISWLDNLKIRASYGSLGNNTLGSNRDNDGNYTSQSLYAQTNYVLARAVAMGLSQTAIANAALTWETTYITNVGLDYNVLGNRLSGSIEFFNKKTDGILIDLPAPMVHGNATIPKQNAAQVTNKGLEFSANWSDRAGKDFSYNIGFNFTYIKNNVDKFKGDDPSYDGARMLKEGRTDAKYPRLLDYSDTRNEQYSDFWVASKAYLKIRNITLGYTLPSAWTKVAYMDRVRIYGSLENFFTFTKWKGYDPEIDGITYPTMRQAVIGVNVTF